jgi:pantothenate kinase
VSSFTLVCASGENFKKEDIVRSLLLCISNDIGQIAYLQAQQHGLKKIYFGGYFIRGHPLTMHTIGFAINYWSKVATFDATHFISSIYCLFTKVILDKNKHKTKIYLSGSSSPIRRLSLMGSLMVTCLSPAL